MTDVALLRLASYSTQNLALIVKVFSFSFVRTICLEA